MKSIAKSRVYDQNDWKNADRVGKILIHVCDPNTFPLSDQYETYYERIRMTARILNQYYSDATVNAVMRETFSTMSSRAILQLRQDTDRFYGSFDKESKKLNWIRQQERLLVLLEKLHLKLDDGVKPMELEDEKHKAKIKDSSFEVYELIIKTEKQLAALRSEMPEVEDDVAGLPFGKFEFTNDPKSLRLNDGIEDADIYEET